jgi:riboflavin kinase/FMN adenylyltransferase
VGRRPTFYGTDGDLLVEAHLLSFSGDLYGEGARVSFVARLHDDIAFSSAEALIDQIQADVDHTRSLLAPGT